MRAPLPQGLNAIVVALLLDLAAAGAFAQAQADPRPTRDLADGIPSADEINTVLFSDDACLDLIKIGQKCMVVRPVIEFSLPAAAFALGSAALPPTLKQPLDVFAEVLRKRRGSSQTLHITGHTDASGSVEGNLLLSKRRAEAVKRYLVEQGADASMLATDGVGSSRLMNAADPRAAVNRRVTLGR